MYNLIPKFPLLSLPPHSEEMVQVAPFWSPTLWLTSGASTTQLLMGLVTIVINPSKIHSLRQKFFKELNCVGSKSSKYISA